MSTIQAAGARTARLTKFTKLTRPQFRLLRALTARGAKLKFIRGGDAYWFLSAPKARELPKVRYQTFHRLWKANLLDIEWYFVGKDRYFESARINRRGRALVKELDANALSAVLNYAVSLIPRL